MSLSPPVVLQLQAENLIYFSNLNKKHSSLYIECAARKFLAGAFATLSRKFWFHGTVKRELKEPVHKQSGSSMLMSGPSVKPIELEPTLLVGREEEGRKSRRAAVGSRSAILLVSDSESISWHWKGV